MTKPTRDATIFLIAALLMIVVLLFMQRGKEPPGKVNAERLRFIEQALKDAYVANGEFPEKLEDLSLEEGTLIDSWGSPFVYKRTESGAKLTSLGVDNKPGGHVFNQDVSLIITPPK